MSYATGTCGPGRGWGAWGGWSPDVEAPIAEWVERLKATMSAGRRHQAPRWDIPPMGWAGRGWPFGPDGGGGRPRTSRGDVRAAILVLLAEGPRHGYQIIQDVAERSAGAWRTSPGSVYPALSALQDEGLVDDEKVDGRRVFSLTAAGQAHVAARAEELAGVFAANSAPAEEPEVSDLRQMLIGLGAATLQVGALGSPEQVEAAQAVLRTARSDLYRLLADDSEDLA